MIPTKLLAFKDARESLFEKGRKILAQVFPGVEFDFQSNDPFMLVFLSGGSEKEAVQYAKKNKFVILAATEENNSFAAAVETKAFFDQKGVHNVLIDLNNEDDVRNAGDFIRVKSALSKLEGQNLGLIGEVSDWLLASSIKPKTLKSKLGIHLQYIEWSEVANYQTLPPDTEFLSAFIRNDFPGLNDAGKVHAALTDVIKRYHLSALTVECFSLVKKNEVTACLSLSRLNDLGIPAGCEGDIASIVGMMMIKELTGIIPWMANLIKVSARSVKFAHCTAPTNLLDAFEIQSHYETGFGTSVAGQFKNDDITIFRVDNRMKLAFLAGGTIVSTPKSQHACRTQIEVELAIKDAVCLRQNPLGNHHLILPGHHAEVIRTALQILGMQLINK